MGKDIHTCVKNRCNSCGWEGCYCEMVIDDRKIKDGVSTILCPICKGQNITFVKYNNNSDKSYSGQF